MSTKKQYAWKVVNKQTLNSSVEYINTVKYRLGEFVYESRSHGAGLFVFRTRAQAREFAQELNDCTVFKCEVIGLSPDPYIFLPRHHAGDFPSGTMWCKAVKLLHKQ